MKIWSDATRTPDWAMTIERRIIAICDWEISVRSVPATNAIGPESRTRSKIVAAQGMANSWDELDLTSWSPKRMSASEKSAPDTERDPGGNSNARDRPARPTTT